MVMWWPVWCAAVLAGACAATPDLAAATLDLAQIDSSAPEDDSMGYAMAPMGGRYANIPWVYLLADLPRDTQRGFETHEGRTRLKRKMPSLSINNPMEVLRQRLILEVARKQMREASQRQAEANRVFLKNVGKRGFWANSASSRYDNYN